MAEEKCEHKQLVIRDDGGTVGWVTCQQCGEENTPELIAQAEKEIGKPK